MVYQQQGVDRQQEGRHFYLDFRKEGKAGSGREEKNTL